MEIKKSEFPKVLEAYVETMSGPLLENSAVVFNQAEANAFLLRYANCTIKSRNLNAEELKGLPRTSRLKYMLPSWVYWLVGISIAVGIAILGAVL